MEKSVESLKILGIEPTYDPAILPLGIYPQETIIGRRHCSQWLHSLALIQILGAAWKPGSICKKLLRPQEPHRPGNTVTPGTVKESVRSKPGFDDTPHTAEAVRVSLLFQVNMQGILGQHPLRAVGGFAKTGGKPRTGCVPFKQSHCKCWESSCSSISTLSDALQSPFRHILECSHQS